MPISMIKSNKQVDYKLIYSRVDRMPNSLKSMVVCSSYSYIVVYIYVVSNESTIKPT